MYAIIKSNPSYTIDKHGNVTGIAAESIISRHRTQAAAERVLAARSNWPDYYGASVVEVPCSFQVVEFSGAARRVICTRETELAAKAAMTRQYKMQEALYGKNPIGGKRFAVEAMGQQQSHR